VKQVFFGPGPKNAENEIASHTPSEQAPKPVAMEDPTAAEPLSVGYFKELLATSTTRLDGLCNAWESKQASLPDHVQESVRSVIGMARILMGRKGRFFQFDGLIDDCALQRGEQKTTLQDLQVGAK